MGTRLAETAGHLEGARVNLEGARGLVEVPGVPVAAAAGPLVDQAEEDLVGLDSEADRLGASEGSDADAKATRSAAACRTRSTRPRSTPLPLL